MKLPKFAIPPQLRAAAPAAKAIALVLVLVAAFLGTRQVLKWREAAIANAATVQRQGAKIETTNALTQDGAASSAARANEDAGIAAGADQFTHDVEDAKAHDPETATRAGRAVPQRVRDAYRARRLARERLNDPPGER